MSKETYKITNNLYMDIIRENYYNYIIVVFETITPKTMLTLEKGEFSYSQQHAHIYSSTTNKDFTGQYNNSFVIAAIVESILKHRKDPDFILNFYNSIMGLS